MGFVAAKRAGAARDDLASAGGKSSIPLGHRLDVVWHGRELRSFSGSTGVGSDVLDAGSGAGARKSTLVDSYPRAGCTGIF